MMKLKTIKTFTRRPRKELEIKIMTTKLEKNNIINLDWMMKLKTNKKFIKDQGNKLEIKRIMIEVEIPTTKRVKL